jgi:PAS domain S-box-containing protein
MKTPLLILHLEDSPADAALTQSLMEAEGISAQIKRVETSGEFQTALEIERFDLILSDFSLPSFNGLSALEIARRLCPDVPFIFVSGTLGEETAVQSLKQGAVDYVLKDRLSRLGASVRRAVEEAEERLKRKRVETELRQRDELFRRITASVEDLIAVLDLEGRRVFNSPSYAPLLGDPRSLVGTDSFAEIHSDDRERVRRTFRDTVASGTGHRTEYRFLAIDGTVRNIESQGSILRNAEDRITHVVVVSRDITERREAEQRMREQAALLDRAQDAIFVRDLDQRITYWNQGAERIYGWKIEEVLGQRASELLYKHDAPFREDVWKAVIEKGEWTGELNQVTKSGREVVIMSRRTLLRDATGKPTAILNINTDITDKKQIEAQFLRSQRLENIGTLAGGIAHDLNNVLSPVLMAVELLRRDTLDEFGQKMLDTIKASAQRGADLVKQILSFARGAAGEMVALQLKHLIKDAAKLAADTFPRSIKVQTNVPNDLRPIVGDATQLHQVLLNLCVNARDAMPKGGILRIEAENIVLDNKCARMLEQPVSGRHVVLTVSDTGTGIPAHLLERIFEPFFTTKEPGKGTGLGLSTVMSIVKNHQGFLEVVSQEGNGTAFKVYFPTAATDESVSPQAEPAGLPAGRGEQLLLVDDELAVLEMTKETLETFQYRVLMATNGAEAASLYRQHRDEIDVVITDLMMPVMDGAALVRSLRSTSPQVKIICVSGLASESKLTEVDKSTISAFLHKPYTTKQLLTALKEVLSQP